MNYKNSSDSDGGATEALRLAEKKKKKKNFTSYTMTYLVGQWI
jgi:hypothetical protein